MKKLFWIALALAAQGAEAPRTVILVRHAERAGGMGADVGISEAGRCRAEGLARMLRDSGVSRIYATEVGRTQQTAAPAAKLLGLKTEIVAANDAPALVAKLRAGAPGSKALVVGHSTTAPEIVAALGASTPKIEDTEYDRMLILTLGEGKASLLTLRYPGCPQ